MPKLVIVGAGSATFTGRLLGDLTTFPELGGSNVVLHDIDEGRLATATALGHRIIESAGFRTRITATTDRARALEGADHVIILVQVGGAAAMETDLSIPARYGLDQTIGDSYGIGGIMRGLRTIPVLLDVVADAAEFADAPTILNFANPMAANCWAMNDFAPLPIVGLCHSVPYTANYLARDLGIGRRELEYVVAGINHLAFFLELRHNGADLRPRLEALYRDGLSPAKNKVRYELLARIGYFVTESSEHFAEYNPWFLKKGRPDLISRFNIPVNDMLRRQELRVAEWRATEELLVSAERVQVSRSEEFALPIIASMVTDQVRHVYANVRNEGAILNLPRDCIVEVPCSVDAAGVHPAPVGCLPPVLQGMMEPHITVQRLLVEAAVTGRRQSVYEAAMLDPHTAAVLDLDQIWELVDLLLDAHRAVLPMLA